MLDAVTAPIEDLRSGSQPRCHAIEDGLVFQTGDTPETIVGAARFEGAGHAGVPVAVVDLHIVARPALVERRENLLTRADEDILFRVIAELFLGEETLAHGWAAMGLGT